MLVELSIKPHDYAFAIYRQIYTQYQKEMTYPRFFDGFNLPVDTPRYWVESLGADVNGFTHPVEVAKRTTDFIETENQASMLTTGKPRFSTLEEKDLVSVALNHDIGELKYRGFGPGDIADPAKTESSNNQEALIARLVIFEALNNIYQKDYQLQLDQMFLKPNGDHPAQFFQAAGDFLRDNLDDRPIRQGEAMFYLYRSIAQNRDTHLGKCFYLIEKMQYLSTGMKAFSGYHPYPDKAPYLDRPYHIGNRTLFAGEVLQFHLSQVIKSTNEFAYPNQFLSENQSVITAMVNHVSGSLGANENSFTYLGNGQKSFFSWDKFNSATNAWQQWQVANPPNPPTIPRQL
jgi:hypothetical protein